MSSIWIECVNEILVYLLINNIEFRGKCYGESYDNCNSLNETEVFRRYAIF